MTTVYIARVLGSDEVNNEEEDLPEAMIVTETHNDSGLSGHYVLVSIFDGDSGGVEVADLRLLPGDQREIEFQGRRFSVLHHAERE